MWKWGAGLLGSLWGENLRTAQPTPVRKKVIYKQLSLLIQFCVGFYQLSQVNVELGAAQNERAGRRENQGLSTSLLHVVLL